ncbi:MAG: FecCD family ABC transporter permease [Victivallaceae bacterium]
MSDVIKKYVVLIVLAAVLAVVMMLSVRYGVMEMSWIDIIRTLFSGGDSIEFQIIYNLRLPRTLLGALVGAALAVAGVILQAVMRNPLASPGIIGVSSGAGLAAVVALMIFPALSGWLIPVAFGGAFITATAVYLLAWKRGVEPVRLLLAGVAVSSLLGAMSTAIMLFNSEKVAGILDFAIGSLSTRSWPQLELVAPYIIAGLAVAVIIAPKLNILGLGDEIAVGLGMNVERMRLCFIALAALLAGAAVSVVGLLGFVGLIAPHIVRMIIGGDSKFLIPGAAIFGAVLVVGSDTAGRVVIAPEELPLGIIMALLGPPFFLWLLRRRAGEN